MTWGTAGEASELGELRIELLPGTTIDRATYYNGYRALVQWVEL